MQIDRHATASKDVAPELLVSMETEGYVKLTSRGKCELTDIGRRFAQRKFGNGITRETADNLLARVVERAKQINNDARVVGYVRSVSVFGGYLRESAKLGDLDIAVDFVDISREVAKVIGCDFTDVQYWQEREKSMNLGSYLDILYSALIYVQRTLRGKSRFVSVTTKAVLDALAEKDGAEFRIVYQDNTPVEEYVARFVGSLTKKDFEYLKRSCAHATEVVG